MKIIPFVGRTVAIAALLAGLTLSPAPAMAKTSATDVEDSSFTLTNIAKGDVVNAYQIFDADIDGTNNLAYTSKVTGLPEAYDTVEKMQSERDGRKLADAISAKVLASQGTPKQTATAGSDGHATLTLDSGYWLVVVTSNSGTTKVYQTLLVDATPAVRDGAYVTKTFEETAAKTEDVPAPDKKIVDANGNAGQSSNSYGVGDTARFQIGAAIPNYPADATHITYSVTDQPDAGLDVDLNSFKVTNGDVTLTKGTDYTVKDNGDHTYTVHFTHAYIVAHPGQPVSITYGAKVKAVNMQTGKVGNKAFGTFSPNPYTAGNVNTEPKDPWAQTYGFSFRKLGDKDAALAGAQFTVTDAAGKPVTYVDASGTAHTDGVVASDSNGYVYVNGLKAGTYTVSETKVPSGYQKIADFTVELSADSAKSDTLATDGVTETNFNVSTPDKVDPKQGVLPTTGGAGTIALTAGGVLLVVGGGIVVARFRNREQD